MVEKSHAVILFIYYNSILLSREKLRHAVESALYLIWFGPKWDQSGLYVTTM